jgi:glycosyltransferase involved in cell wall biosynthesis
LILVIIIFIWLVPFFKKLHFELQRIIIQNLDINMPIISVILPVFNGEKYILESVRSILNQTFDDFELIIVDDGSSDSTLRIIRSISDSDSRVIVISRENRGLVYSLNEAVELCKGEWIARMDADDIATPNRFSTQLHWLKKTGADICGTWIKIFGVGSSKVIKFPVTDLQIKSTILFACPLAHPSVMIKSNLLKKMRYNNDWKSCEDFDLWERAARSGVKMTNVPEVLLYYRLHPDQITNLNKANQMSLSNKVIIRYWSFLLESKHIDKFLITETLRFLNKFWLHCDMDKVDCVFKFLIKNCSQEEREIILYHLQFLYIKASGSKPNMAKRLSEIYKVGSMKISFSTLALISLFNIFKIQHTSNSYNYLSKAYFYFKRIAL